MPTMRAARGRSRTLFRGVTPLFVPAHPSQQVCGHERVCDGAASRRVYVPRERRSRAERGFRVAEAVQDPSDLEYAPTRSYAHADFGRRTMPGRRLSLPFPLTEPAAPTEQAARAATCPASIIDTDPTESGLGVWVLVGTEPGVCIYEYAGGIS